MRKPEKALSTWLLSVRKAGVDVAREKVFEDVAVLIDEKTVC